MLDTKSTDGDGYVEDKDGKQLTITLLSSYRYGKRLMLLFNSTSNGGKM